MKTEADKPGASKGETRTSRSGTRTPAPDARAPHLSRTRPAAPECGKRGSRGRYKGWAARMSTVQGARGEGAGSRSPGAGRWRLAPPSPPPRPGVRPTPRRLPPAARGSDTWTPPRSPGEAEGPRSESRGPCRSRGQDCRNDYGTVAGPAPADARGEIQAHGAGRAGWTALPAGGWPDVPRPCWAAQRSRLHPGWGLTVPAAQSPTVGAATLAVSPGSASATEGARRAAARPEAGPPQSPQVHAASERNFQL